MAEFLRRFFGQVMDLEFENRQLVLPKDTYLKKLKPVDMQNVKAILARIKKPFDSVGGRIIALGSSLSDPDYQDVELQVLVEWVGNEQPVNSRVEEVVKQVRKFDVSYTQVEQPPPHDVPKPDHLSLTPRQGGSPIDITLLAPRGFPADDVLRLCEVNSIRYSELCRF